MTGQEHTVLNTNQNRSLHSRLLDRNPELVQKLNKHILEDPERNLFKEFDKNGDNIISVKDLQAELNREIPTLTDAELNTLITELDSNRSGWINQKKWDTIFPK